jgi:hypothetical protein
VECDGAETSQLWFGVLERIDQMAESDAKHAMIREYAREIAGVKLCAHCWRKIDHLLRMVLTPPVVQ